MKYIKILIIVAIIAVLLFFFLKNVDFKEVVRIIRSVDPIYPIIFLVGLYLQFFLRGYRWGLILRPHKKKIPLMTLYNYTVIGFLLNMLPGKMGEPARGILLAKEENINRSYGLASVVLERMLDLFMLLMIFFAAVIFMPDTGSQIMLKLKRASFFAFPLVLLFFFLFYLINTERMFGRVERLIRFFARLAPEKIRERLVNFTLHFVKGLRLQMTPWEYVKLIVSSMLVWLYLIPFYWLLMQGFGFGKNVSLLETFPYFCVLVVSAAIPTPGMAGSFELASRLGLEQLYGADPNQATAYTLLAHFIILIIMVIPGLIAFWSKGFHMKTIKTMKEDNNEHKVANETKADVQV